VQRLWVSDVQGSGSGCGGRGSGTAWDGAGACLPAAGAGGAWYGVSSEPLQVYAQDGLADACRLGQAVEVIGHAAALAAAVPTGGGAAAVPGGPPAVASVSVSPPK
jgi:hypothetical protein